MCETQKDKEICKKKPKNIVHLFYLPDTLFLHLYPLHIYITYFTYLCMHYYPTHKCLGWVRAHFM